MMMNRFERQTILPGFGTEGQQKLQQAKILVVGAGGLGCPVLLYLAAAGIGTLGIADGDVVTASNLNRQVIYGEGDVGKNKAQVAGNYFKNKYSDIKIHVIQEYITVQKCIEIISEYDLVVECSDNFPTRYMINDACVLLKKPLIMGAIYQYEGQVVVFNIPEKGSANYRDIYPNPPTAQTAPNCSETGVLGVLPGIIGCMQAAEALKLLCGLGNPLINKLMLFNLLNNTWHEIDIQSFQPLNCGPQSIEAFRKMEYEGSCSNADQISWNDAFRIIEQTPNGALFVDVRELHEIPKLERPDALNIPLSTLTSHINKIATAETIMVFCKSGIRSKKAVQELKKRYSDKKIHSIEGGLSHPLSPINQQIS
jgi:sulfur-carrier protein adenylyltransferase/sulfurtransferase